ncbi:hypothetical protein CLV46_1489 [Diaminobutyricimonas aerilata]|uniref:Uncharacterized protein n=1 Tax=Diaminobutyricimonas aerilata TaxID=1162967 RepID=A0A2M9CJ49_9MICO|nr:hypothetical protein [Diaminobutyricimonas aerilata]PJJ71933.1 hypothetical protein CLV46_1489 [Diaminobutyricimonas aerilata]
MTRWPVWLRSVVVAVCTAVVVIDIAALPFALSVGSSLAAFFVAPLTVVWLALGLWPHLLAPVLFGAAAPALAARWPSRGGRLAAVALGGAALFAVLATIYSSTDGRGGTAVLTGMAVAVIGALTAVHPQMEVPGQPLTGRQWRG